MILWFSVQLLQKVVSGVSWDGPSLLVSPQQIFGATQWVTEQWMIGC